MWDNAVSGFSFPMSHSTVLLVDFLVIPNFRLYVDRISLNMHFALELHGCCDLQNVDASIAAVLYALFVLYNELCISS